MERRIFLYHTIVVTAALTALLLISVLAIRRIDDYYLQRSFTDLDSNAAQVQSLLDGWDPDSETLGALSWELRKLGYNFCVQRDGRELYSSLDPFQQEILRRTMGAVDWAGDRALSIWSEGIMTVGVRNGAYTLIAMSKPDAPEFFGRQRPQNETMLLTVLVIGGAAILVIVSLSMVSAKIQVRRMMRPVEALTAAARRIEGGDLSQPVGYEGKDEFTAVCAAFEQMQEHLLREREKNAAHERARTDLVAGISHDLRTPLTSVKGYIKGLRDGVANTQEKRTQYLDIAYRNACRMDVLLQRLFYFSKLETGALPWFPVEEDLGRFVERFVRDTAGELEQKGGSMELEVRPGPHPVQIDTEQMGRVLSNLTENAVRYAGACPLRLVLTVWREGETERLRFADNGRGVAEEDLPHLFEQFWREDPARSGKSGEGSGLGLYIVKHIVEAHGGTIRAEDSGGLVFELALPTGLKGGGDHAEDPDRGGR